MPENVTGHLTASCFCCTTKLSSKKPTPRMIDEELSKEFPAVSDDSESPIDFANLLQRIKSVAKILRKDIFAFTF